MNDNPIPDLVELATRVDNDGDTKNVLVDLRIHPAQFDDPVSKIEVAVSVTKLTLSLDLGGVSPIPGTRFGEPRRENEQVRSTTITSENSTEHRRGGAVDAKASAIEPSIAYKSDGGQTTRTVNTVVSKENEVHHLVRAMGNLNWDVAEPHWLQKRELDATYLENDLLCKVSSDDRANSRTVGLTAYARQRDIDVSCEKRRFKLTVNQKRLMAIVVAKALAGDEPFEGVVQFSNSELSLED